MPNSHRSAAAADAVWHMFEDIVFDAVSGKGGALAALEREWPLYLEALPDDAREAGRSCLVKHLLDCWHEVREADPQLDTKRGLRALDIMQLLLK